MSVARVYKPLAPKLLMKIRINRRGRGGQSMQLKAFPVMRGLCIVILPALVIAIVATLIQREHSSESATTAVPEAPATGELTNPANPTESSNTADEPVNMTRSFPAADEGPIIAEALVKTRSSKPREIPDYKVLVKKFAAGTAEPIVQAQLAKWRARKDVVAADWTTQPLPASLMPDDPKWPVPEAGMARINSQLPMSRIGLCCSRNGLLDAWPSRVERAHPQPEVNIAIVDHGIFKGPDWISRELATELKTRFIGEWDVKTQGKENGRTWDEIPGNPAGDWTEYRRNAHGVEMAAAAVGIADNQHATAGTTGARPSIRFGSFRTWDNPKQLAGALTSAQALREIVRQNNVFRSTGAGRFWSVVSMSFSSFYPEGPVVATLLRELTAQGMILVASAGNYHQAFARSDIDNRDLVQYGMNPIAWPAADPHVVSVANYGGYNSSEPMEFLDRLADSSATNRFVKLAAPGYRLPGPLDGEPDYEISGTSPAAAGMSGLIASVISSNGGKYRCGEFDAVARRLDCVAQLRALLLGATREVWGEGGGLVDSSRQGAGVINAAELMLDKPSHSVPPAPTGLQVHTRLVDSSLLHGTETIEYALRWNASPGANEYQIFIDGDGTRELTAAEFDSKITLPRPSIYQAQTYPSTWKDFRKPLAYVTGTSTASRRVTLPKAQTHTFSVVAVRWAQPRIRRWVSPPASVTCSIEVEEGSCTIQ